MNKVVARFADGGLVKGTTLDFSPEKDLFHVTALALMEGTTCLSIHTMDLKALFFVKDFAGDPRHQDKLEFDSAPPAEGRRIRAAFRDGEILVGTTEEYHPGLQGFFLVPADPGSNNERCFVVSTATEDVRFV